MRVLADGQTDTQTDANRFYNLSHAICYSYGTDKKFIVVRITGQNLVDGCKRLKDNTFFSAKTVPDT